MGKITTILFDYDGTLMDTDDIIIDAWQYTYRKMTGEELAVETILKDFGEALRDTMSKYFSGDQLEEAIEIHRVFQTDTYLEKIRMFPGTLELIHELKERGYRVAVVTSRRKPTTVMGLEKFELMDVLDCIVTADETEKHKPDPEPVLFALKSLNCQPEEAIMVGDTVMDMGCGRAAGVKTVLTTWAKAAQYQKMNVSPDFRINAAEELWNVLEALDAE
ncbi:MAG: HAD-IA family hydrolase [Firmicutes bacterium]|nr:HAD-IA family hydrolase [Bacillota bacterium]